MSDTEDRKLLADEIPDRPEWAELRRNILDGSCVIHSDPENFIAESALRAIAKAREQERERVVEIVERHIQHARDMAAHCANWSRPQGEWSRARDLGLNILDDLRGDHKGTSE